MNTDIQRWQRIRALVERAMELSGAERSRLLDDECRGDPSLQREVEELLEHDSPAESLATPAPSRWIRALSDQIERGELDAPDAPNSLGAPGAMLNIIKSGSNAVAVNIVSGSTNPSRTVGRSG